MNRDTDWKLLQHLAEEKRDVVACRLAAVTRESNAAQDKLRMLIDYRREYLAKLDASAREGVSADRLRNYRAFLVNLERAIEQQADLVAEVAKRVDAAKADWRGEARKAESFRVLDDRQAKDAANAENRREQKLQDEFASRMRAAFRAEGGDD
jgi:flagellar protein FliJ